MKNLKITVTKGEEKTEANVKSECAMWNYLRKTRDAIKENDLTAGVRAVVVMEDGTPFKDITYRRNSKGKIEMPNMIKETNRIRKFTKKNKTSEMSEILAEATEMANEEK